MYLNKVGLDRYFLRASDQDILYIKVTRVLLRPVLVPVKRYYV
jgi:hypothetical protein